MRILLADDQPILRIGLMALLRQIGKHVVFHEADTHPEVLSIASTHNPHIAVMDLTLGGYIHLRFDQEFEEACPRNSCTDRLCTR